MKFDILLKNYEYKCEKGESIKYYKKYLTRSYPVYLSMYLLADLIVWLNIRSIESSSYLKYNLILFIPINLILLRSSMMDANSNRDVVFELDRDRNITDEQYIDIFKLCRYDFIEKSINRIKFNKFVKFFPMNYQGYLEYLDDKIRIQVTIDSAYFIEGRIILLQRKNGFIKL